MKVEIAAYDKLRPRNSFGCGRGVIDRWYKNNAKKCVERLEFRVFEALEPVSGRVVGYYALQLGCDTVSTLDFALNDYAKNYIAFPSVHLAFLGVHSDFQRKGIGKALLSDVFDRAIKISEHAGFYALTLQSLDKFSTSFYASLGFIKSGGTQEAPRMMISLRTIRELVLGEADQGDLKP